MKFIATWQAEQAILLDSETSLKAETIQTVLHVKPMHGQTVSVLDELQPGIL